MRVTIKSIEFTVKDIHMVKTVTWHLDTEMLTDVNNISTDMLEAVLKRINEINPHLGQ